MINIRKNKKQISFRVTEEEYKKLLKKIEKSKLKQNEYFLKCGLDKEIKVIDGVSELVIEIKRIGNNINQIAKVGNASGVISEKEIDKANKELEKIWQLLRQLIQNQG